jgi:hypothetical protein
MVALGFVTSTQPTQIGKKGDRLSSHFSLMGGKERMTGNSGAKLHKFIDPSR